jgi:cyclase
MKLDRRQFIVLSSGALSAAPLTRLFAQQPPAQTPAQPPAQTPPPPPTPVFTDVRRNVGIFTARGGTIGWLINKDGVVVVDTQYPDSAKMCVDGLKGKTGGRTIDVVFNTHHHADHTGGNGVFRAEAKKIVAQTRVPELQKQVASTTPNAPAPVVADATFDKTWSEKMGDETLTAQYNGPGHTGGDAIIHFERAHVVHMGDLLFYKFHPRVDRPAGASIQNWIKILEKVAKDMPADTIYVAGHAKAGLAPMADRTVVLAFRDYFDAALTLVRKGIAAGQTKDAITATAALPGFEDYQTSGLALSLSGVLGVAYDELTAK